MNWFYDDDAPLTKAQKRGRHIYTEALAQRRGFSPDQIGIPTYDPVWLEIFDDLALAATPTPSGEAPSGEAP